MSSLRKDPIEAAQALFTTRYSTARAIFLAGSVSRGEEDEHSDLDLAVVFDRLPQAYNDYFIFEGWPVEALVHDPETLHYRFNAERRSGYPLLTNYVSHGLEIPGPSQFSQSLKKLAISFLEVGPLPLEEEEELKLRLLLISLIDDVRRPRSREELIASAAGLYERVAEYYFRSNRFWAYVGKTTPKGLKELDAVFYERFFEAFEALFTESRSDKVIDLVEKLLKPHGGLLYDSIRINKRPGMRLPVDGFEEIRS